MNKGVFAVSEISPRTLQPGALSGKPLRQRLAEGDVVYGPFMKLASPQIVEIAGYAGFDFIILDTEHGPLSFESIENLVRAAEAAGISPVVRVYENNPALISRALDVGAEGILAPHISTPQEAASLTTASRFAPQGERGVCRYVRAARYTAVDRYDFFKQANEATLVMALVEGKEGLANLEAILSTPGLDAVFVGPYDLSQSLGIPGNVSDERVTAEMERAVTIARSHGVAIGTFVDDLEAAKRWTGCGVQFLSFSVDVGIVYQAMKNLVGALRG